MPRFGDELAALSFSRPYNIRNEEDIVPSLPPKWFGYSDTPTEYTMDGLTFNAIKTRETKDFLTWIISLITFTGISHHNIEIYLRRIYEQIENIT